MDLDWLVTAMFEVKEKILRCFIIKVRTEYLQWRNFMFILLFHDFCFVNLTNNQQKGLSKVIGKPPYMHLQFWQSIDYEYTIWNFQKQKCSAFCKIPSYCLFVFFFKHSEVCWGRANAWELRHESSITTWSGENSQIHKVSVSLFLTWPIAQENIMMF